MQVRGKAETQELAMPMRCTPWPDKRAVSDSDTGGREHGKVVPGKKRAVLVREAAFVELHLVQFDRNDGVVLLY